MKQVILFSLIIVLFGELCAQPKYDKNIIKQGIYLNNASGILNYSIDNKKPINFNYLNKKVLNASARCENVNILVEYINPLKVSYDLSYTTKVNPDLENTLKFMNTLTGVFKQLKFKEFEGNEFKLSDFYVDAGEKITREQTKDTKYELGFNTEELYRLGLLVIEHPDAYEKDGYNRNSEKFKDELLRNLGVLHKAQVDFTEAKKLIKATVEYVIKADDAEKAKTACTDFFEKLAELKEEIRNERDKIKLLEEFYKAYDEADILYKKATRFDSLRADFIKGYRYHLMSSYREKINSEFGKIDDLISGIEDMGNRFQKGLQYYYESEKSFKIGEVPISSEDIKEVSIVITIHEITLTDDLELKVSEKSVLKGEMSLKDYSLVSVDFGAGFLFPFNLKYNKYSTANDAFGNLIVTKIRDGTVDYSAGIMLNIIFKTRTYPVFPLLQFGVGTGQGAPTLFAGAGIKFIKNMSLSGGIMSGWYKELNNLKEGDIISGNDVLDNDYQYVHIPHGAFYIGVQYSF